MDLDALDRGILRILQEDGRMSYSEMARRLGVPESTIRLRVKKLKERGVIRKFAALMSEESGLFCRIVKSHKIWHFCFS